MQPTKIALQNFLSYGEADVDLTGLSLAAILGQNGAGKSSLLEAITWPLYGEGRWKDLDRYVRQGQENATAELQFELNGETYRVIRTRSNKGKGKSTLELARWTGSDWESISGTTIKETQDKLRELLRMDYEAFVSSCVLLQEQANKFNAAGPAKRMDIFGQILGLDIYDRLQEAAKVKAKQFREQVTVKRATIENLTAELSDRAELRTQEDKLKEEKAQLEQQINDLEQDLANQEKVVSDLKVKVSRGDDLYTRKQQITRESADIVSQLQNMEKKRQRLQQIIERGPEIREKADELDQVKKQLADCEGKAARHMQLSKDVQELNDLTYKFDKSRDSEIARIEATVKSKRTQAELLDEVPCTGAEKESCKLLASAREAAAEIDGLQSRLQELQNEINPHVDAWQKACATRDAVGYDAAAHQALREKVPGLEKWAKVLPELEQAESTMSEQAPQAQQLQKRQQELTGELSSVEDSLAAMERTATELRKAEALLSDTKFKLTNTRQGEQDIKVKLGTVQARLKDLSAKAEQKKVLEAEVKELATDEHYYTRLARAYKEIPVLIMENALPDVEDLANELLGRLAGGRISVRFETQKEAKTTGNVSDTLDIIVSDELGERPYEGWSGAERFEVDLAVRLAISKFLAKRAGTKIEVLIIDEGASCLDTEGRQHFIEAMNIIAEDFHLVLCITHIDELKEAFPQQLIVSKTPEGSRVEVVA